MDRQPHEGGDEGVQSDPGLRHALGRAGRAYAEAHFGAQRAAEEWSEQLSDASAARRAGSQAKA